MESPKKRNILWYIGVIVIGLLLLDQVTKVWIMQLQESFVLIPNILEIQPVQNTGGAFGVGQNSTGAFIITNIVVLGLIVRFIWLQKERMDTKTLVILLVILAGGLGNVMDRIGRGFVVDFIRIFPSTNFPCFNIADACITIGWVGLAFVLAKYAYQEIKNKEVKK